MAHGSRLASTILLVTFCACGCVGYVRDRDGERDGVKTASVAPAREPVPCADEPWPVCADEADIRLCVSGYYEIHTCSSICELHGYGGGGASCAAGNCQCGAPANEECARGAEAVCHCLGCADGEFETAYAACELEQAAFVACFAVWADGGFVDCAAASSACL